MPQGLMLFPIIPYQNKKAAIAIRLSLLFLIESWLLNSLKAKSNRRLQTNISIEIVSKNKL